MRFRTYFDADGNPSLPCPFARLDIAFEACDLFGSTSDPEAVLDHIVEHHDPRYVARALMHLELLHDDIMGVVATLDSKEMEEPAEELFGPVLDETGAALPG